MFFVGLTAMLAFTDLSIKNVIENQDDKEFPRDLPVSKGRIRLYKSHNTGFPFGIGRNCPELVRLFPLMLTSALAGIFGWLLIQKGHFYEKLTLSVTLGGALSNLYDRLVRHYVVDYFSIEWRKLKDVIFNLGDLFIFLGAVMICVRELAISLRGSH